MADTSSVVIAKSVLDKLDELFKSMAGIAKQGGDYFWPILVRQQIIEGIACGIGFILITVLFVFSINKFNKYTNKDDCGPMVPVYLILMILFGIASLVFGICFITDGIGSILNPEYYALQSLAKMAAGK